MIALPMDDNSEREILPCGVEDRNEAAPVEEPVAPAEGPIAAARMAALNAFSSGENVMASSNFSAPAIRSRVMPAIAPLADDGMEFGTTAGAAPPPMLASRPFRVDAAEATEDDPSPVIRPGTAADTWPDRSRMTDSFNIVIGF